MPNFIALHKQAVEHALKTVKNPGFTFPCGFVWSRSKGNTAFGRAMLKAGIYSRSHYYGGAEFSWSRATMSQSMDYKEELARVYRNFLADNGVEVSIRTNID